MRQLAVACCVVIVACWTSKPPAPIDNHTAPLAVRDPSGSYWCSIEDGGYKYPRFPCAIRKINDRLVLAKLAGSQRFEGEIKPAGAGFSFEGRFYCPWGDCNQALHGTFEPGEGGLRGTFRDSAMIVRLVAAPETAFGGATYGGDGYGGFGYGGAPAGNRRP